MVSTLFGVLILIFRVCVRTRMRVCVRVRVRVCGGPASGGPASGLEFALVAVLSVLVCYPYLVVPCFFRLVLRPCSELVFCWDLLLCPVFVNVVYVSLSCHLRCWL